MQDDIMYFDKIKKYCKRKKEKPTVNHLDEYTIEFTVENNLYSKYFRIHYQEDGTKGTSDWDIVSDFPVRKKCQHYLVYFYQDNYPYKGSLIDITGQRWFYNETDALDEVRRLCKNWKA